MEGTLVLRSASRPDCSPPDLPTPPRDLPPPPPPPPPPPLPPPHRPASSQQRSMKRLNWDTIPRQLVVGKLNVWTSSRTSIRTSGQTSSRPLRDLVLDLRTMEELFSHGPPRAGGPRKAGGPDPVPQEPQVTILDSKRSMNIGIFLRNFKRPVEEVVEDIRQGNWLRFEAGKLKELCKLLPEQSEVKLLQSFRGKTSALADADRFMVLLIKVPGYEERLKAMVLREEFFPLMEDVKISVAVMTKAANELLDCDDLHSVIRLVLKAGNYMNAGGYSANAIGFRMSSLLKLADTKANRPGMNLMHYVAKQAEDIDAELLTFTSQLDHIGTAARICKEEVVADFETEVTKIREVKAFSSSQPSLLQQMEMFFLRAEAKLADVESSLRELDDLSRAVAEYFCEDPASFRLEECCSIFHSFCRRFDKAVQENREREATEQRLKRTESMRFTAKRRSTGSRSPGSRSPGSCSTGSCSTGSCSTGSCSTGSCSTGSCSTGSCSTGCRPAPDPGSDSTSLECALHNLLSTAPDGRNRNRRNLHPVEGPPSQFPSRTLPAVVPPTTQENPEKKHLRLQGADETDKEMTKPGNEGVEATRQTPGKSPGDNLCGNRASAGPGPGPASPPNTPQPRTRDFFFANNGELGSPWTILSPVTGPRRRGRVARQQRPPSASQGVAPDEVIWEDRDQGPPRTCGRSRPSTLSEGSASLPERLVPRPVARSASVDEGQGPPTGFRLGDLFQTSHWSSISRGDGNNDGGKTGVSAEGPVSTSGLISFFRRIGGRSKPDDSDEEPSPC